MDEIVTNEQGGRQSRVHGRYDLLPPQAVREVAKVLEEGCTKYGKDNWHNISVEEHINHCLSHLFAYLLGEDSTEDDLSHAACRALMALEIREMTRTSIKTQPVSTLPPDPQDPQPADPREEQLYQQSVRTMGPKETWGRAEKDAYEATLQHFGIIPADQLPNEDWICRDCEQTIVDSPLPSPPVCLPCKRKNLIAGGQAPPQEAPSPSPE